MTKLGLTLPSFRSSAEHALEVARVADAAGIDGVFAYDHLFRRTHDSGALRPAIEMFALLGAVAAETTRVALGSLVARVSLRPAAMLAHGFDTIARIVGPERLVVTLGAGDHQSREENERYGLPFGTMADRVGALRDCVLVGRDRGYPVWVGGHAAEVRGLGAAEADGWNAWGAPLDRFTRWAAAATGGARREPFTVSWGGLVVVAADDAAARDKAARLRARPGTIVGGPERVAEALRAYAEGGAEWVIAGPVDSSDPENASLLGERVAPLLT
jgi:alkanesulfonate monooxygenase SsuD/methylene tetrahydromethanopterin reductase-like flavin-dependent oxidoreductase (luciferase family)